jgi:hypothetical protein
MAKPRIEPELFRWNADDPLAEQHERIRSVITAAIKEGFESYNDLALKATNEGRKLGDSAPEEAAEYARALVARLRHLDREVEKARERNIKEKGYFSSMDSDWERAWVPRQATWSILKQLLRRKLPLGRQAVREIAQWIAEASKNTISDTFYPLRQLVSSAERLGVSVQDEGETLSALKAVVQRVRGSGQKDLLKLADRMEELLGTRREVEQQNLPKEELREVAATPMASGSPTVLVALKEALGIPTGAGQVPSELVDVDRFYLREDSPLKDEHDLISRFLPEVIGRRGYDSPELKKSPAGREMLALPAANRARLVVAVAERCVSGVLTDGMYGGEGNVWQTQYALFDVFRQLLSSTPIQERNDVFDILTYLSALVHYQWANYEQIAVKLVKQVEGFGVENLTEGERHTLHRIRGRLVRTPPFGRVNEDVERLNELLKDGLLLAVVPGEAWSDAVNSEISRVKPEERSKWIELLRHAGGASSARPSEKWRKSASEHLKAIGTKKVAAALLRWLPLVNEPRTIITLESDWTFHEENATCLRGLLWLTPELASAEMIRCVSKMATSCYRKIPGMGPRAVKVGNAAVYALSQMGSLEAVGQLGILQAKVKFGTAQKEIEKAFRAAAADLKVPEDEIQEMAIPTYGLTEVGLAEEKLGEFTARLRVMGTTSTELEWMKADGKLQKGVPAVVKEEFGDELKELKAAAKDIERMLPAQRERIDTMFLQEKSWPVGVWRERYLDHPLVGVLARRLLWEFSRGGGTSSENANEKARRQPRATERTETGIWYGGKIVDLDLREISLDGDVTVRLWHPIGKEIEEVMAWREWLDAQQIQQPFKQAHREVYVLTEAERRTRTYSNRYAAHVLKQHQFNALCALRGWKNKLRMLVDGEYPPATLHLPKWGLRAEFWIEGAGTEYGTDTNESGAFLRVTTDQVRFYREGAVQRTAHAGGGGYHPGFGGRDAEPLALEEIPPLVFSEVMRDVDMFVGVASVGNDPTWSDGGPNGQYRDYWGAVSFGELNGSAKTRKEVLERLVPRLKIGKLCTFEERFLVVKGKVRTYRIHLGSGNILMEPNDQYLCIVPKQGEVEDGKVLLPFEGDRTLSVILSKAFLLAEDNKIKDETIVRQIEGA